MLTSITASESLVVALGPSESWRSEDGTNWNSAPVPQFAGPFGMVYGGGKFVGVGQGGGVVSSTDGIQWELASAPGGPFFYGIAYGNGKFVAVGIDTVQTSVDAKSWTPQTLGFQMDMYAVAFGSAGFVAVGQPGTVALSQDGQTWHTNSFPSSRQQWLNAITFDREYIAVGQDHYGFASELVGSPVFHSTDAVNWQVEQSNASTWLRTVASGGGRAIALGTEGTVTSSEGDLKHWTESTRRLLPVKPVSCAVGSRLVISAAGDSLTVSSNANALQYIHLETASWQTNDYWSSLAYGNNEFMVISGYGKVATSTNGYDWTEQPPMPQSGGFKLIYVKDRFFARNDNWLFATFDGISWQKFIVVRSHGSNRSLVAYGNGLFMAPPYISADGTNWVHGNGSSEVAGVAFGNGRFITLSSDGDLSYSTDAVRWTKLTASPSGAWSGNQWSDLQFVEGQFIAVSGSGKLFTSTDGNFWAEIASFGMIINNLATDGRIWAASDLDGGLADSWPDFVPIAQLNRSIGARFIESSTQTGSSYSLLHAHELEGPWELLASEQPGSGERLYWPFEIPADKQFFRILQR